MISAPLPLFQARSTAAFSVDESPPPSDIEITLTFCVATQLMQFATSEVAPVPSGPPSALQITSGELNATPDTPTPLLVFAEIVPATCVPWSGEIGRAHV